MTQFSQLGLDDDSVKSLTLLEWNPLVQKMQAESLQHADLLGLSQADSQTRIELPKDYATRITKLADRTNDLQHLFSYFPYFLRNSSAPALNSFAFA
jgi:hypothetical protein